MMLFGSMHENWCVLEDGFGDVISFDIDTNWILQCTFAFF